MKLDLTRAEYLTLLTAMQLADWVLHLAPPPSHGAHDTRTASASDGLSPPASAAAFVSRKSKNVGSSISAYFAISASPA